LLYGGDCDDGGSLDDCENKSDGSMVMIGDGSMVILIVIMVAW
jgi:hypothetical protein